MRLSMKLVMSSGNVAAPGYEVGDETGDEAGDEADDEPNGGNDLDDLALS